MSPSENLPPSPLQDNRVGFDRVEFPMRDGMTKMLTKAEFERLPLRERVDSILNGRLKFFLRGTPISATQALKG